MTAVLFSVLISSLALIVETLIRSAGFHLPLLACTVFYFAYVRGPVAGLMLAVVFGMLIDFLFGFTLPFSCILFVLTVPLAQIMLKGIDYDSPLLLMPAGALMPIIISLPGILFRSSWGTVFLLLPQLFLAAVLTALLLPGIVALFDLWARKLCLPAFNDLKEMRKHHAHE